MRIRVDKVDVDTRRNGKRAQDVVDVDLVFNLNLRIGVVGGLSPAQPHLAAALVFDEPRVRRRHSQHKNEEQQESPIDYPVPTTALHTLKMSRKLRGRRKRIPNLPRSTIGIET